MPSSKKKAGPAQKQAPLIYCGPSLPRGLLNNLTVYRGGLPKHLDEHFEKCPALKRLFVPVDNLSATQRAIIKLGTAENVWYGQVLEYFKGGVK